MPHFVITGARVFDGEDLLGDVDVEVVEDTIASVGGSRPAGAELIDGTGATVLPGLIDAHTHTDEESLRQALTFGVTTELDMVSIPERMNPLRRLAAESDDLADVRSSSIGLTPANGHPHQVRTGEGDPPWPTASRADEVPAFVEDRIAEGADYLKVLVEDGHLFGFSLPRLAPELVAATAREAHARGKLVVAHAMTVETAEQVVDAGVDGLTHLFFDQPHSGELIEKIAAAGVFVIPTLSVITSITGESTGAELAKDPRVRAKLTPEWLDNLSGTIATSSHENLGYAFETLAALHRAGVDILAGTDAAHLGAPGMAHGVSLHGELRLLVRAGWTPIEALRAVTSVPARRFGLADRGRIRPGLRADLTMVTGDPTVTIGDTLEVQRVWRGGAPATLAPATL
ncbi:amidohydrolase family protein [Amycolatopsis jiangsuensis]|uniref:Imidazolonepropionase-like amidohydrolase n=1 Tax=Amycolatopsis jiangsuensis TaxID=1181879 RepID=A0A840IUP4_9PSEU|nr:amidohydrolase family protein [Amycolatopsis jiangsuensis]MBB4685239.1 imidazolonepropionase-like amidohydrolase [Amycolatopsis jiangsuensis]